MKSLFQLHKEKWQYGCGSESCRKARHIVHYRGKIPCDILFVGEAPGLTEDARGYPFIGVAGQLLDAIVEASVEKVRPGLRVAFCNVVGCMPREEENDRDYREPPGEQIEACKQRLEEFIVIASPKLIVTVGRIATDHLEQGYMWSTDLPDGVEQVGITHPSALLQMNVSHKPIEVQKQVIRIRDKVLGVFGHPAPTDL